MAKSRRNWHRLLKPLLILLAVIILIIGFSYILKARQPKSGSIKSTSPSTQTDSTSQQSDKQTPSTGGSEGSSPDTSSTKANGPSSGASLQQPSGQFVSNHHPGKDDAPTAEQSVCNTTPGAKCMITFKKGDTTKTLEAKTADSNGNVIWNWDTKDAGFTSGSWTITATATLNGQSLSAQDTQNLEVP